jgi:ABC-type Na+ efflux pump permease subunit
MNKSMIVAMWDIKNALTVRFVKYGLVMAALFGPVMNILLIGAMILITPLAELSLLMDVMVAMVVTPMLAIFSIIPTTMISANALVGEREQNTLEPLLCSPLTDRELLWGKTLASALPSLMILIASVITTLIGVNAVLLFAGYPLMLVPDVPGLFQLFTAVPLVIFAIVAVMILISGKVTRVYEAYQTTGAIVVIFILPMMLPIFGMSGNSLNIDMSQVWFMNFIILGISAALFAVSWGLAYSRFNRDQLVSLV